MRKIAFRAWDRFRKQMSTVKYLYFSDNGSCWLTVYPGNSSIDHSLYDGKFELMQFTGLRDKNGKEIYEGDLVQGQHLSGEICFGEWQTDDDDDIIGWFIKSKHPISGELWDRPLDSYMKYCEVLGNIYENPELLK